MKRKTISIKSKTPELREINHLGAKGWSLDEVKDIYDFEGNYLQTDYTYHKVPFICSLLNLFLSIIHND